MSAIGVQIRTGNRIFQAKIASLQRISRSGHKLSNSVFDLHRSIRKSISSSQSVFPRQPPGTDNSLSGRAIR